MHRSFLSAIRYPQSAILLLLFLSAIRYPQSEISAITPEDVRLNSATHKPFNSAIDLSSTNVTFAADQIPQAKVTGLPAALAAKQPLDSDLTALAALATDPFGRGLLPLSSAAAVRAYIGTTNFDGTWSSLTGRPTTIAGFGITDFNSLGDARWQPLNGNLTAIAALTTDAFGRGLLPLSSAGAVRTYIGAGTSNFDGAYNSLTGLPTLPQTINPIAGVGNPVYSASFTGANGTAITAYMPEIGSALHIITNATGGTGYVDGAWQIQSNKANETTGDHGVRAVATSALGFSDIELTVSMTMGSGTDAGGTVSFRGLDDAHYINFSFGRSSVGAGSTYIYSVTSGLEATLHILPPGQSLQNFKSNAPVLLRIRCLGPTVQIFATFDEADNTHHDNLDVFGGAVVCMIYETGQHVGFWEANGPGDTVKYDDLVVKPLTGQAFFDGYSALTGIFARAPVSFTGLTDIPTTLVYTDAVNTFAPSQHFDGGIAVTSGITVDADAAAGDTRLLLWDVTAGTLKRVSRGAADSGGTGFRLLRVPN